MRAVRRPFWLNVLRELRQPLAALASLLVIINLATATAAAHPGTPWASLCIGSTTVTPDGETTPSTTCQHCCFAIKAQPAPSGPTVEAPTLQGARVSAELRNFANDLRHDPSLFGPRGPPESV